MTGIAAPADIVSAVRFFSAAANRTCLRRVCFVLGFLFNTERFEFILQLLVYAAEAPVAELLVDLFVFFAFRMSLDAFHLANHNGLDAIF